MKKPLKISLMVVGIILASVILFVASVAALFSVLHYVDKSNVFEDFGTSKEYRAYKHIFTEFNEGEEYTKESILEAVGAPERAFDKNGEGISFDDLNEEESKQKMLEKSCVRWGYTCTKHGYPYRLVINFDDNGNATKVEFDPIPGG